MDYIIRTYGFIASNAETITNLSLVAGGLAAAVGLTLWQKRREGGWKEKPCAYLPSRESTVLDRMGVFYLSEESKQNL